MQPNPQLVALAQEYANTLYLSLLDIVPKLEQIFPYITFTIEINGDPEEPESSILKLSMPRQNQPDVPFINDMDKLYLYGMLALMTETYAQDVKPALHTQATWDETRLYINYTFIHNYSS